MMKFSFRLVLKLGLALAVFSTLAFASGESYASEVPVIMMLPFAVLLVAIAVVPFISRHWWKKYYPHVAVGLGLIPVAYYVFALDNGARMLQVGKEYLSFIVLIGSLFVVAGGIHLHISGKSTPFANVALLTIGAVAANILGTTGASLILIRPYLRVNKYRMRGFHVVFFIFVVSNIGGGLTPLGPPLFLGYLKGVPFWWVLESVWQMWFIALVIILAAFFVIDTISFRKFAAGSNNGLRSQLHEEAEVNGLHNVFFLAVIVAAMFVENPLFLREALMVAAAAGSFFTTQNQIHVKNDFNFAPITEVAILFVGIFATMVPALDWLELHAGSIGFTNAGQFNWGTGILSGVLDNAPAYLNFLSASIGLFVDHNIVVEVNRLVASHGAGLTAIGGIHADEIRNTFSALTKFHPDLVAAGSVPLSVVQVSYLLGNRDLYLKAISVGSVFFGACTYIGNGPNFMVKSIAERSGVVMPSFFGYIGRYTVPLLLPTFALIWFVFFRS